MAGIYIHMPYCKTRCPYCDFFTQTSLASRSRYEKALIREMELRRDYLGDAQKVETIYFGGGTPSLFTPSQLGHIVEWVYRLFPVSDDPEVTLEANPDDVSLSFYHGLLSAGINRLSLGTQSFIDEELKFLGRRHNAAQNHQAIQQALEAGFTNISLDLIYGLPLSVEEKTLSGVGLRQGLEPGRNALSVEAI
ncbi:MAG TPA: radical SAM protein, partial [Bacteroidales bacterium]|nr:radical SAM protein [Bacteroidales bacterium]